MVIISINGIIFCIYFGQIVAPPVVAGWMQNGDENGTMCALIKDWVNKKKLPESWQIYS